MHAKKRDFEIHGAGVGKQNSLNVCYRTAGGGCGGQEMFGTNVAPSIAIVFFCASNSSSGGRGGGGGGGGGVVAKSKLA